VNYKLLPLFEEINPQKVAVLPIDYHANINLFSPESRDAGDEAIEYSGIDKMVRTLIVEKVKRLGYNILLLEANDERVSFIRDRLSKIKNKSDQERSEVVSDADAILRATITEWDIDTFFIYASLSIEIEFELYSKTLGSLWEAKYQIDDSTFTLDKDYVGQFVLMYEPMLEKIVDAAFYTMPAQSKHRAGSGHYDWLP